MEVTKEATEVVSPSKAADREAVEAFNHLVQGKRHLLVQDFPSAVNSLEEACRLLGMKYGDLADECGEAYLNYGIALLEMARCETGVLGNQMEENNSEEDEDEDDDGDEENEDEEEAEEKSEDEKSTDKCVESGMPVADARVDVEKEKAMASCASSLKENCVSSSSIIEGADSEAKSEDIEESDKTEEEGDQEKNVNNAVDGNCVSANKDSQPGSSKAVDGDVEAVAGTSSGNSTEKKEEEVSTLQLAWEVLELSKIIFKRQSEKRDMQLKLSKVYAKLGEVAMESENYPQSVEDLQQCLGLQLELLSGDDRAIAETYYNLGLVFSFSDQHDIAIENFKCAISVIEKRINNLKNNSSDAILAKENNDPFATVEREVEDLENLLPELREKITDTEDLKKNNNMKLNEILDKDSSISGQIKPPTPVKMDSTTTHAVSNISHLVRKKRKPEEDAVTNSESDSKKVKSEVETAKVESMPSINKSESSAETQVNGISSTGIS